MKRAEAAEDKIEALERENADLKERCQQFANAFDAGMAAERRLAEQGQTQGNRECEEGAHGRCSPCETIGSYYCPKRATTPSPEPDVELMAIVDKYGTLSDEARAQFKNGIPLSLFDQQMSELRWEIARYRKQGGQ